MYNISAVAGILVSFTFTPSVLNGELDEVQSTRIIVALKSGELFSQELNLARKGDKGMQVDQHQSEISLT